MNNAGNGHCAHGDFDLAKGCPQCVAEKKGSLAAAAQAAGAEVTVDEAPKRVSSDLGSTGMVDHWKHEVVDFAQLPDEFKVADTTMLNAIAKKHHDQKQVPGVRFYNEPYLSTRSR